MGHNEPIRKGTQGHGSPVSEIPDKLYFRIGEVARLCEVPAYVLRFWESEFPQLRPNKGGTGQRLYRRRDVEMALRVKSLLKEEGYTIPGARAVLKSEFRQKEPQLSLLGDSAPKSEARQLRTLRRETRSHRRPPRQTHRPTRRRTQGRRAQRPGRHRPSPAQPPPPHPTQNPRNPLRLDRLSIVSRSPLVIPTRRVRISVFRPKARR